MSELDPVSFCHKILCLIHWYIQVFRATPESSLLALELGVVLMVQSIGVGPCLESYICALMDSSRMGTLSAVESDVRAFLQRVRQSLVGG